MLRRSQLLSLHVVILVLFLLFSCGWVVVAATEFANLLSSSFIGEIGRWNIKGLDTDRVRVIEMIMICPFSASYWEEGQNAYLSSGHGGVTMG